MYFTKKKASEKRIDFKNKLKEQKKQSKNQTRHYMLLTTTLVLTKLIKK